MSAAGEGVAFDTHHANRFHHIFPITEGFSRIGLAHNDVQAVAHLLARLQYRCQSGGENAGVGVAIMGSSARSNAWSPSISMHTAGFLRNRRIFFPVRAP